MILSKTVSFSLLTFLFSVSPALATDISPDPTRVPRPTRVQERLEIRQENQEERQEIREENREDRQELRITTAQERFQLRRENSVKIANNIVSKFEKRFVYLNKIKDRLQSKIDTLKTKRDMTEAQKKLNLYSTTQYTTDLNALKAKVATISTTDNPKKIVPELKEAIRLVQNDLKDLHQYLVDTLKVIVKSPKITPKPTL